MNFLKTAAFACAATALAVATPAAAQMEPFEDYTPSEEVLELTIVKVDAGQFETYLAGLKETWVAGNEVAKKLGHIKSYAIWGVPYGDGSFNLMLTVTYPDTASLAPSKERYDAFMAEWGKEREAESNRTVIELYNKIRKIKGVYMLRRIDIKTD